MTPEEREMTFDWGDETPNLTLLTIILTIIYVQGQVVNTGEYLYLIKVILIS